MVIYLRDRKGINYFEVEFYEEENNIELHASVYSTNCFKLLLREKNEDYIKKFINSFEFLEELRGWYYEVYLQQNPNPTYTDVLDTLRKIMKEYAGQLDFWVVED